MGQIYISTLAFKGLTIQEVIGQAISLDLAIEFTSNFPYSKEAEQLYLKAPVKRMPHNYFPTPEFPFVLNLASENYEIQKRSIDHCINGLKISKMTSAPFFAAHAGFCIDPKPTELGNRIEFGVFDKDKHKKNFLSSIAKVVNEAEKIGISFLVENNVIIKRNLSQEGKNPLLCCESEDIFWLFNEIKSPFFGLLLDTAHLKVSCNTLNLNKNEEVIRIKNFVKAVHHSDNNGIVDSNDPLRFDYWFWTHMELFKDLVHVAEVSNLSPDDIKEHIRLFKQYGC